MIKTFKTRIYPTKKQREYFANAFGIRRWTWNWALNEYLDSLNNGVRKSAFDLQKQLNNTLVKQEEYSWLKNVNSMVRQESLKDLSLSIKKYHDEQRKARLTTISIPTEKYKPKYKSKKREINSFRYNNKGNPVKVYSRKKFRLTTTGSKTNSLVIKCAESISFLNEVKFCTMTIKEQACLYYVYITYETTNHKVNIPNNRAEIGIDMGMKTLLTCSDSNGKEWKSNIPLRLRKQEKHTERLHKLLSRKKYNSNRYNKIKNLLQKSYIKENNIKKEFREQTTTMLAKNYKAIKIENFNTKHNTLNNINRALSRLGKYEFLERLKFKAEYYNTEIKWVSWTPTTQTCSHCGHRKLGDSKLTLNDRIYVCENCGSVIDRDVNAARNILKL